MQGIPRPATTEPTRDFPKCQDPAVVLRGEAPQHDYCNAKSTLTMRADHTFAMCVIQSEHMHAGSETLHFDVTESYAGSWAVAGESIVFSGTVDKQHENEGSSQRLFQFSSSIDQLFRSGTIAVSDGYGLTMTVLECNY